jgi:uncharacterized membrane protein
VTPLAIDPYVNEWLDFLLRWLHVVAAIVWIGTSFYFVALDNHLRPPERKDDADEGIGGETWEIHGGGFYRIQKFRVAPRRLPDPLHWFKWEAYTTWLSGFALFVVLYYVNADTYLIDKQVADLETWQAVTISIALLAVGWVVYDALCRLLDGHEAVLAACIVALVVLTAWGASQLFSPRAAWLQTGAMLGTIMVANVLFVIIPGHWQLVRAKEQGREPDPVYGIRGKQRSVHNNYFTLPVLVAMLGNHFPAAYAREHGWAILVALMLIGAWIRHYFNLRHAGRTVVWIPLTAALAIVAVAWIARPEDKGSAATAEQVSFAQAQAIVEQRCAPCHSASPTNESFSTAPKGIRLDTPDEIAAQAEAIERQAVDSTAMPLGNVTGMTDAERDLLGYWIAQGAKTDQ